MPYPNISDLPPAVRHSLPTHAQEIFKEAFNSAYKVHNGDDEVTAFKIAWAAVKKTYKKQNDKWIRRKKAS